MYNYKLFYKNESNVIIDSQNNIVYDPDILYYIKSLVIPPAYKNVKIYYYDNRSIKKILYEGYDSKGRKQVIYSPEWIKIQEKKKFNTLLQFSKSINFINTTIKKLLNEKKLTKNKIIAMILQIIIHCGFRVGSKKYLQLYNSYGITNIKKEHVAFLPNSNKININFVGKKGVLNTCTFNDKLLYQTMLDIFNSRRHSNHFFIYKGTVIKEKNINNFLKKFNPDFTSKLFRTYYANIYFINELNNLNSLNQNKPKKEVVQALKVVADAINNTPAISKKNYIHNGIIDMYINNQNNYKKIFLSNKTDIRNNFIKFLEL